MSGLIGWSVWSKDIIFLISEDSRAGPQAWVDAYHDMHDPSTISSLPIKSGAIQGVVVVDYPDPRRFESIHIIYDGVNGQLPNLDLINTASQIAIGQMGIRTTLQEMWQHTDSYQDRLRTMLRGMMNQGLGHASGAHSPFIPYHIDAITLQAYGDGWHDELALGRVLESLFRSLNNLLEHFHQSFFFYLLMAPKRFVSIGTYLPSAMLIAVNFTIVAIGLWAERQSGDSPSSTATPDKTADGKAAISSAPSSVPRLTSLTKASTTAPLLLPVSFVLICHALGFIPLYIFNNLDSTHFTTAFFLLSQINLILPVGIACLLCGFLPKSNSTNLTNSTLSPTHRLTSCFSLLLLGMFLSALATLNFSLSLLIGLISTPLSFSRPYPNNKFLAVSLFVLLQLMSPTTALWAIGRYWELPVTEILAEAAFGWRVWGMWTQVVVWCVWYPAWVVGAVGVAGSWVN